MTNKKQQLQEVEQGESLTPEEHLESILFQFVNLYERWSEDRQVAAKQGADMAKFVKEFTQQVSHFAELEEQVRDDIHVSIRSEAENMAVYSGKTIGDAARKEVEPIVKKLQVAADDAENQLAIYQSEMRMTQWKIIGVAFVATIMTSLLMVWLLMPKATLPLTDMQMETYQVGKSFTELWPTLSKEKQKWFLNETKKKQS